MQRRPIMLMGCTSDAGKSFLTTALCRHLVDRGLRVAPFKAQNMSTNAAVTPDGHEIGRAQYVQAKAAGLAGARVAGEMDWALRDVPGTDEIIECESRINELVKEAPITVMCQYDLRKFDGAMMFDVMNVHPVMIVGGHILRNPFFQKA